MADWSDADEGEISETLEALGSKQLPVVAVFSSDNPYKPQVITGTYTKTELISKIKRAGPSKQTLANVSTNASEEAN